MVLLENRHRVSGLSRGITSFTTDCAVPSWWVSSWEKPGWVFSCRSPRSSSGLPDRSYISVSVFTLEKANHVHHPTLSRLLGENFHKLLMIIVVGSFLSVDTDIGSPPIPPLSQQLYSRDLISITFSSPGYWSRGWYVRRRPCNKASSLVPILLWLVLHLNRVEIVSPLYQSTLVELKWLILNKHNKWFPLITCGNFLWLGCQQVDFWCRSTDWIFWVQVDSIEQPIKRNSWVWKRVSLWGLLPLMIIWSLLRCPQTHTTKLLVDVWGNTVNNISAR